MSAHLTPNGEFRSDKFPEIPTGYVLIKVTAPEARIGLLRIVEGYMEKDPEFARDLQKAVLVPSQRKAPNG